MGDVRSARRIVVKIGTSTLTHDSGRLNLRQIGALSRVLADIKNEGREVIIVTSGAIAAGVAKLKLPERPKEMRLKQAAAAVGQCELMHIYDNFFEEYGHTVAQVLLTKDDVDVPERRQNVINTFESLLELGTIPIVNENDTVSVDEIMELTFGENDTLSVIVAKICSADLLIILSDIDGLFDEDPRENPDAHLIPVVYELTDRIRQAASGAGTERGSGGMITKLNAAEKASEAGIPMIITNGSNPELLYGIFKNEPVGTLFLPAPSSKMD
ncbi:MAG: glutamate 5-kinase [Clostridiales bacterium]|nr:glutamate 5-kinase [Clostridiales bacterium]